MKLQRSRNTKRNIIVGLISRVVAILLPFVTQTIFIRILGNEYNGLRGMFCSILQILCVAELGFGSAMVFSMYKPIAEEDDDRICALLSFYRKVYRVIGAIILGGGVVILPFLGDLIKDKTYPDDINIYLVYFIYLINTVLSYWMFSYKSSVLEAFQRQDIVNTISLISSMIVNIFQIIVLVVWKNFYLYVFSLLLGTILNNILISIYVNRKFPRFKCKGEISKQDVQIIKKKVTGLAISRICYVTRNGFDSIFLSFFLGLSVVGIYNLYYNFVFLNVINLLGILTASMLAGIGNSVVSETVNKNYNDFRRLDYVYMLISGTCAIFMCCLYQPFMKIWAGEESMFPDKIMVLFCVYFYVSCMGSIRAVYSDAAGLWWENRYRVIAEMICNVFLNFILGKFFGVEGIILATCISLFLFGFVGSAFVLFRQYFKQGCRKYFFSHIVFAVCTLINGMIVTYVCNKCTIDNMWGNIIIRIVLCSVLIPAIYFCIYRKTEIYSMTKPWIKERISFRKTV